MTDIIGGAGQPSQAPAPDDTLTLLVNNQELTGWQSVQVIADCERVPRAFDIAFTDRYPGMPDVVVKPGDTCRIMLGNSLVLTGYIDRFMPALGPRYHAMRVQGRGKCQDLVDCSAIFKGMQISGTSTLALAQSIAAPYGITVRSIAGDGPAIPQFNVTLGETCFEIIERVARYSSMLAYEDENGDLVLAQAGQSKMASGFAQGINVQDAQATFSMDGRYSTYLPAIMSTDSLSDLGSGNTPFPPVKDSGVPRFRELIVVSEQFQNGVSIAQARAQWEMVRRYGRSQAVSITCDSWRDSNGDIWQPNAAVPVINIPGVYVNSNAWVIARVVFVRDQDRGTVADLEIMPKEAFTPEPSVLQLYDWQVGQALQQGGAGNSGPTPAGPQINLPPASL